MVAAAKVRITERIPHNSVSYAYLELEASSVNEFNSLRDEALTSPALSHYAFASKTPAAPKVVADVAAAADDTPTESAEVVAPAPAAAAPSTEGMTAREKARAKILAAKGA